MLFYRDSEAVQLHFAFARVYLHLQLTVTDGCDSRRPHEIRFTSCAERRSLVAHQAIPRTSRKASLRDIYAGAHAGPKWELDSGLDRAGIGNLHRA